MEESLEKFFRYLLYISIAIFLRSVLGLWGHSGEGIPPMFGDFEAQRHWMEITIHLPIGDWYRNTTDNNLLYWGLDYPPLTAYTSKIFGHSFQYFHPPLVEWETSHGHESVRGKFFMRLSVILFDCLIYIPIILWISHKLFFTPQNSDNSSSPLQRHITGIMKTILLLNLPGLLLIDHGHFQYNGVCIGLALASAECILSGYDVVGSFLFTLSLNYKQMSLYYSLVFFFLLLRKCNEQKTFSRKIMKLFTIGCTVIVAFAILWLPFCIYHSADETCISSLLHVLSRQFPFNRGIFEDKVANIWYFLSRIIDFRRFTTTSTLVNASIGLTLILILPISIHLLTRRLTRKRMYLSLFSGAMAFFLASFQVHEKSILLASVPNALLINDDFSFVFWFQLLSNFTMFPLLKRDQIAYAYSLLQIIWITMMELLRVLPELIAEAEEEMKENNIQLPEETIGVIEKKNKENKKRTISHHHPLIELLKRFKLPFYFLSVFGMIVLHFAEILITPPQRYPDLFPALFALYGSLSFLFAYIYALYSLWTSEEEEEEEEEEEANKTEQIHQKGKKKIA